MLKRWMLAVAASGILSAQALTLQTAQGAVELDKVPEKIAVYDVGVIDSLVALGLGDKIVGIPEGGFADEYKVAGAKSVGTLFEPDLEALNALQPDLIIVAQRSADKLNDVKQVAQAVDLSLPGDNLYAEGVARVLSLGEAMGRPEAAKTVVDELNALRDEVKPLAADKGKVLSVLVNGPKIALYGPDSRIGWVAKELGLALVHNEKMSGRHGEPVSFEYIAEQNPDWIIALDRLAAIGESGASAKETLDNALVHGTTAWQKGQVVYPDTRHVYINLGGPSALKATLLEMKAAFAK